METLQLPHNLLLALFAGSCTKNSTPSGNAALNIIHAAVNTDNIVVNFTSTPIPYYENQSFISFGSSLEFGLPSGANPISVVSSDDTSKTIFSGTFTQRPGNRRAYYFPGQ